MQPDSTGVWYSDTGLVAFGGQVSPDGHLTFTVCDIHGIYLRSPIRCLSWFPEHLPTARWQKAEPPEFEKLPEKPKLVYASSERYPTPQWWVLPEGYRSLFSDCDYCQSPGLMTVIPHPDNDPEAVAMIEAARKGGK